MTAPPFWIQRVAHTLEEEKAIPFWGESPPFPWEACQEAMAQMVHVPEMRMAPAPVVFRTHDELLGDLGGECTLITLQLAPLAEPFHWAMRRGDVRKLTSWALTKEGPAFSTPAFQEGFYRFLALQILEELDRLAAFKGLSPHLAQRVALPKEGAFCLDVEIETEDTTLVGRAICPQASLRAFKAHWAKEPRDWLKSSRAQSATLRLRVEIGHVTLSLAEWKGLSVGDGILPNRCSFQPEEHKGSCTLVLYKTPLFQARIKEHAIKIVDFAYYEESFMDEEENEEAPPEEESEEQEEVSEGEEHMWEAPVEEKKEARIPSDEIALSLTLELGKIEITLSELLKLQPGNALELPFRPEAGVHLVLHGKRIGRGELVQVGDSVVVRILELSQ